MTLRLLVNNVEQIQPDHVDGTLFKLHCRDAESEYHEVTVRGFRPYFYVPRFIVEAQEDWFLSQDSIDEIEYGDFEPFGHTDVELAKVYTPYPQDTRDARALFDNHYSADVPFTRRLRIDAGIRDVIEVPGHDVHWREIKPVEHGSGPSNPGGNTGETTLQNVVPRVVTLDIEADDRNGFPEPRSDDILSIVAHDSYAGDTHTWLFTKGRDIFDWAGVDAPENPEEDGVAALGLDDVIEPGTLHLQPTQRQLLIDFACWVEERNPDLIAGWNSNDFDIPYIIKRMDAVGASQHRLARDGWAGMSNRGEPRIKGRTCYDLMTVYDANSYTELRSKRLDAIAKKELGAEKIEFEGSYYGLYDKNLAEFLRYGIRDVELTVGINEKARVVAFRDALRRQVGVDFEDSYDNKDFVDMMCRRRLKEWGLIGPSRPAYGDEPESDFEGAFVFDPFTGVAENVVAMDLASLYPYTMGMLNASPETKVGENYDGPTARASNGQHFALDQRGLFPSLVEDAIELKSEYKETLKNADPDRRDFWEIQYTTAKTITNSLYGVTGWARFFLYDRDVAEAVTLTGQSVIKATADYVGDQGFETIYGDTDSVYIQMPEVHGREWCLEKSQVLAARLNNKVYPGLADELGIEDNMWEIEVEAFMTRYFQAGKKKRYAYLATWKDGHGVENPEPTIVGFEYRRSDSAQITADLQADVFDAILQGDIDDISNLMYEAASSISDDDPDLEYIGIPGGLGQRIDPAKAGQDGYYAFSDHGQHPQDAHPRGTWNANHLLGTDLGHGDKPMRVYLEETHFEVLERKIDVICFEQESDLDPIQPIRLDVTRMIETVVIKPLSNIVSAVGVDAAAAARGQKQTGLGAWT